MQAPLNQQAQYSRRNCLLFHEIKEGKDKEGFNIIINTVKEEMDIEILPNDLDRSHHIGNLKSKKKKRTIIVKLVRYNLRHNIFKIKKLLYLLRCFDYGKPQERSYGKTKQSQGNLQL